MQLNKKKELAARTLGVGKERVTFNLNRLAEIKEAITKQDIRDLLQSRAIIVKEIHGRKKVEKRKRRRGAGSIKKKVKFGKRDYMTTTRRLRKLISRLRKVGNLSHENYLKLRKEIRSRNFKDAVHLKERLNELLGGKNEKNRKNN